jgi:hypothetical protein
MTEPITDPLSGLPSPSAGTKPSPLNEMGEEKDGRRQRWWLADSVQPDQLPPPHGKHSEAQMTSAQSLHTASDAAPLEVTSNITPSPVDDHASQDAHLSEASQANRSSQIGLLIAGISICAILFLIFKG